MTPKLKLCVTVLFLFFMIFGAFVLGASERSQPNIYHIVICWLKEPDNQAHRQTLIEETKKFQSIPGIVSIEVGNMLPSERPIVDSSFDIGIIMSFKDQKAMNDYLLDPQHQKATREILAPLTSKVVIYDFVQSE